MLTYQGKLVFYPPLNNEEYLFFNKWQNLLNKIYNEQSLCSSKDEKNEVANQINTFLGSNLNDGQLWTITFAYSPHLTITHDEIVVDGTYKKGQLREALLAYEHFFIGKNPLLKNYLYEGLQFINEHKLIGQVEAQSYNNKDGYNQWCYIFTGQETYSVNTATIKKYNENPNRYPKDFKEDTLEKHILSYFSKQFHEYAKLNYITSKTKQYTQNNKFKI